MPVPWQERTRLDARAGRFADGRAQGGVQAWRRHAQGSGDDSSDEVRVRACVHACTTAGWGCERWGALLHLQPSIPQVPWHGMVVCRAEGGNGGEKAQAYCLRPTVYVSAVAHAHAPPRGNPPSFAPSQPQSEEEIDLSTLTVKGTSKDLEKSYFRLTAPPDPSVVGVRGLGDCNVGCTGEELVWGVTWRMRKWEGARLCPPRSSKLQPVLPFSRDPHAKRLSWTSNTPHPSLCVLCRCGQSLCCSMRLTGWLP